MTKVFYILYMAKRWKDLLLLTDIFISDITSRFQTVLVAFNKITTNFLIFYSLLSKNSGFNLYQFLGSYL